MRLRWLFLLIFLRFRFCLYFLHYFRKWILFQQDTLFFKRLDNGLNSGLSLSFIEQYVCTFRSLGWLIPFEFIHETVNDTSKTFRFNVILVKSHHNWIIELKPLIFLNFNVTYVMTTLSVTNVANNSNQVVLHRVSDIFFILSTSDLRSGNFLNLTIDSFFLRSFMLDEFKMFLLKSS